MGMFMMASLAATAQESPLWTRYPAISPDGETVAFSYKGDIYTVAVTGGEARAITTTSSYESKPIWSPDGETLAFESDRFGGKDVFIASARGGVATRLTTHSAFESPVAFSHDGKSLLYTANIMPDKDYGDFPDKQQVYSISLEGGRPKMLFSHNAYNITFNSTGDKLYYTDWKGYEDEWRKHHTSSVCRDVWSYDLTTGEYKNMTNKQVEDRNPAIAADDATIYFLSERFGTFNVCKMDADGAKVSQLTSFDTHPVRFLTAAKDGTLCFYFDGEIYTMKEGAEPKKLDVTVVRDQVEAPTVRENLSNASSMTISPSGNELVYVARGNVFATSTEYNTTRAITSTPEQERNISISPDGRTIIYSSERDGQWHIYKSEIVEKDDKSFVYASDLKETKLTSGVEPHFQGVFSPDGKKIAFLKNRTSLMVMDVNGKNQKLVLDGKYNYSYSDGDQTFSWSPDSEWLLVRYFEEGGWSKEDIGLVKADGSGEVHNLTNSGYSDGSPVFVMGGSAIVWSTDKMGYRSHGSWGSQRDFFCMFLTEEAWEKYRMNKEDMALSSNKELSEEAKQDKRPRKEEAEKDEKEESKPEKVKTLEFEFENLDRRMVRLTPHSGGMYSALITNDGKNFFYIASYEGGADLYIKSLENGSSRVAIPNIGGGSLTYSNDGNKIYLISGSSVREISEQGQQTKEYKFRAVMDYSPVKEREYMFNHAWQQVKDKFYDPEIHGIDWEGYKEAYARFLPYINNKYDFADALGEMLGELNGSHTGARFGGFTAQKQTLYLGAFFDSSYEGDGLKIAEILANGPLDKPSFKLEAGDIITHINGQKIVAGEDYYPLLSGLTSERVRLTVKTSKLGKAKEEYVKPVSYGAVSGMLYTRWVEQRKEMVEELSGGKLGYIHIKGMDSGSFREVYSELLGEYRNKEAIVIDTRSNGGGWLHEDLLALLSGKRYADFTPQGQFISSDPLFRWTKPSAVIVSENNYSNAHGFPWAYKELGIGKLVGTPVPGTMTAVWWERQIDSSIVFGIPQLGIKDTRGNYLENQQLMPDVEVYNLPGDAVTGVDKQLEAVVEELLKDLK